MSGARRDPRAIAVHGGAGPGRITIGRRRGVEAACERGWAVLAGGGSALDAVIEAVVVLENDPRFNAGLGSVLTVEGGVEMDASVMDGTTLAAGAVGMVRGVPNPVRLARCVMEAGREVFLVGPPTERLARECGLPTVPHHRLVTRAARQAWRRRLAAAGETVGAVATDARGRVAAATSTGGMAGKRSGRIGDSAVIGAGTYADDTLGAGSATGPGEAILRAVLVRTALATLGPGSTPAMAARRALATLHRRFGQAAGLILVDPHGRIGLAHTTDAMPTACHRGTSHR